MQTTTPSWLDIMPALPLARSVPLVSMAPNPGVRALVVAAGKSGHEWRAARDDKAGITLIDARGLWRVDLNDPQGFAYALRYYFGRLTGPDGMQFEVAVHARGDLAARHLTGETTDADRLALARALAAVVG